MQEEIVNASRSDLANFSDPSHPDNALPVNTAMLLEDNERRQYEIESAFSELPTGYDDDDERALERDFGDTLTDQELTDSRFSSADGGFFDSAKQAICDDSPAAQPPPGPAPKPTPALETNSTTMSGAGSSAGGEPPEEIVPGSRYDIAA